jgi:hypothetical protein
VRKQPGNRLPPYLVHGWTPCENTDGGIHCSIKIQDLKNQFIIYNQGWKLTPMSKQSDYNYQE